MTRRRQRWASLALAMVIATAITATAAAAPPEPRGAHPRILLDATLRANWKKQAGNKSSAVGKAIARCDDFRARPKEFARDLYMGLDWAQYLQACLVAHVATGKDEHARTALLYFTALIDDLATVGDGKGGNEAARRDSGFAIRAMGPYPALAYDWLHAHPGMTPALRARARERFKAWTDWYLAKGYRARNPSTNYQAGYLIAATLISIAQGSEGGDDSARLWRHVADDLWGNDMAKALAPGGVLDGGDWGEGWQYGPLSVAEYALAARAIKAAGVAVPGIDRWLEALLVRFVHGLSPAGKMFVGGDTQTPEANLAPNLLVPGAVVIGDAPATLQRHALAEIKRLGLGSNDFPLYGALIEGRGLEPLPVPRDRWPTFFLATGVSMFYARSDWSDRAIWTVLQCSRTVDVDHMHPNAGNLVLSRGSDDVIVDPSPYGTLSTLTSNAPTVESAHLPAEYKPSQAFWSEKTGYRWAKQVASGLVVARCDYADQYKFQHRPSDVPAAVRDIVVWPHAGNATIVVLDRAESGDPKRGLHLRFRTTAQLSGSDVARGKVGRTAVAIRRVAASGGKSEVRALAKSDCFQAGVSRGGCDAPRFPVHEMRLVVPGPTMSAAHVIDASGAAVDGGEAVTGAGFTGVKVARDGKGLAVIQVTGGRDVEVPVAGDSTLIVLDAAGGDQTGMSAKAAAGGCAVAVGSKGEVRVPARPAVVSVSKDCKVAALGTLTAPLAAAPAGPGDKAAEPAAVAPSAEGGEAAYVPPPSHDPSSDAASGEGGGGGEPAASGPAAPHSPRSGCCGAQSAPEPSAVLGLVVLALIWSRRGRRA
jgi:MYXO-CTERM domain-containing protein